ncbi:MAG: RDD family protein [Planctomycetaceae bacterium]
MSIKFRCSKCNHGIKVADDAAGKAIKCPQCDAKLKVPSGREKSEAPTKAVKGASGSRKKRAEDPSSDAFLENLDLDRLIDTEVKLCQKCATEIPEGETACPSCGFDPEQLTAAGRKRQKMSAQGIDPATFYEKVWSDSFRFGFSHIGQMMKTGFILTLFFLLAGLCAYYLVWVATVPPRGFWTLLTTVSAMIPLGWLLVQHLEIMHLTLHKKDEIKKIHFDFALCGMSGVKFVAWVLIYGLPFWVVFGGLGVLLNMLEVPFGLGIGLSLALISILIFTPQAMSHLTMPVEVPGWVFPKIVPTLGVTALPGLMWVALFLTINLPVVGPIAGVYFLGKADFQQFADARLLEGKIHTAKVYLKIAEGATSEEAKKALQDQYTEAAALELPVKQWSWLVWPISGGIFCCFLISMSSVIVARANGLFTLHLKKGLNLITQSKEIVWESRQKEGKLRTRKTTMPAPPIKRFAANLGDVLLVTLVLGLLGFIFGMVGGIILESAGVDMTSQVVFISLVATASVISNLVLVMYFVSQESGLEQATVVKKAMNMYVCTDEMRPISTGQAVIRALAFLFLSSLLTVQIGNLMALFREDRKTLHDLLSGTQVRMDKPAPPKKADE